MDSVGVPVAGATVRVEGSAKSVKSDKDGLFALEAPPTYDLTVVHPTSATSTGLATLAFSGLTTRQPRVQVVFGATHKATSTTITPTGAQGGPLPADGVYAFVFAPNNNVRADAATKYIFTGSSVTMTGPTAFKWIGEAPFDGVIHGFRYTNDTSEMPTGFQGYGTQSFSIGDGATTSHSVDLATLTSLDRRVEGTVAYGDSAGAAFIYHVRIRGTLGLRFSGRAYTPTSFSLPFPPNSAMRAAIGASGKRGNATAGVWKVNITAAATGAATHALTIPPELVATAPAAGALDVDDATTFSWNPLPSPFSTYQVSVTCKEKAGSEYQLVVMTNKTSTKLPNPTALGVPTSTAKTCTWTVMAIIAPTTNDLVGPAGWGRYVSVDESLDDGAFSTSAPRDFTLR
ncbi:MAG: hypothetical protein JNL38_20985 [Myxococcales bacterium]|nr:hypothetical protein [Myxococcales bacterium]